MTNGGEAITDLGVDNQIGNEGDSIQVYFAYCKIHVCFILLILLCVDVQQGGNNQRERGVNRGHGLHRMNRAMRGRLQVVILVRNHLP
jgi:hypothetical protein